MLSFTESIVNPTTASRRSKSNILCVTKTTVYKSFFCFFTNGLDFVDLVLVDEEVEEGVEVVEEHDHFRRLDPGADVGEADDVAEQHRHRREHLARVQRALASSGHNVINF